MLTLFLAIVFKVKRRYLQSFKKIKFQGLWDLENENFAARAPKFADCLELNL